MPLHRRRWPFRRDPDSEASEVDQALADSDQTAADTDQTLSDRDQDAAEADQVASDRDQAAADQLRAGSSSEEEEAYESAKAERGEGTLARAATGVVRAQISEERDEQATRRDEAATARDEAATAAEAEAEDLAALVGPSDGAAQGALEAAAVARQKSASSRGKAAEDRRRAAQDRQAAARDRELLRDELERAHIDGLTGAYRRGIGDVLLRHELARAQRRGGALTIAFIDVDELKSINDTSGHMAGDMSLRAVADALKARLRPYDPLVRWGGDEFVCAIPGATDQEARERISGAQSDLARSNPPVSVSIGLAAMEDGDALPRLVERADTALLAEKRKH